MKNFLIIIGLVAVLCIMVVYSAYGTDMDAPHNASNSIGCEDCHPQQGTGYSDELCLSCHTNATGGGYTKNSAPRMLTHSSVNTGDKYGSWTTECKTCHSRHQQDQVAASAPAAYLVTGTIASVTDTGDGTTTFGYTNLVENIAGWADPAKWGMKSSGNRSAGNERGLILFADTADPAVNFEVLSADAVTLTVTVKGSINAAFPGKNVAGKTFALAYGQYINAAILTAESGTRSVIFYQNSSVKSFAYNDALSSGAPDPSPDGICQVCHTRTSFWRSDGALGEHFSGSNCNRCHKHEAGFRTSCDVCHDAPPATGKHAAHSASTAPQYGSAKVQSTPAAYDFGCGTCHQGTHLNTAADPRTVEVVFSGVAIQDGAAGASYAASAFSVDDPGRGYAFNYSDGTCSNTYCHGNYPGSGNNAAVTFNTGAAACGSCHNASSTASPSSGSHQSHASLAYGRNYPCTLCHEGIISGSGANYVITDKSRHVNGFVDWKFDQNDLRVSGPSAYSIPTGTAVPSDGINRFYGTCTNTYCHSIAQTATGGPLTGASGEYVTSPQWGMQPGGSRFCGPCHKNGSHHNEGAPAPMDSGSHAKHLTYTFNTLANKGMRSYKCAICHRYEQQGYGSYNTCDSCHTTMAVYSAHADGKVNVAVDSYFGAVTYNDATATPGTPGNGFFSCSNSYCHSSGTSVSTGLIPANTSSVWGSGTLSCDACHGNPPSYPNGAPKKNSHPAHSDEPCNRCHLTTTANGTSITSTTIHVNKVYDVSADTVSGVTFTYTFAAGGGSCTNISCHGGNSATWGGIVTCQTCHLANGDADDYAGIFYNNGTTSRIQGAGEWDAGGHGRPAASGNYASGNPAADFTVSQACLYCHDNAVSHKMAGNPFRLRNIADAAWGMNGVCQSCHAAGSAGVTIGATPRNGTAKVGSTHYGSKHNAGANGGQFCWDCHDPHGDGNLFMVQASVAKTSDILTGAPVSTMTTSFVTFATGTGYAASAAPFTGVCNVCHTSTDHYTATSGDGHNADTRCTLCHAHTRDSRDNAFQAACDACHGNPPVDDNTLAGFVVPSRTGSVTAGAHSRHVDTLRIGCDACHANSVGSGASHANGDLTVSIGFSLFGGIYTGGSYSGQTTVSYNASGPSTTVSSNGLKECGNIYCHGSTMAPNGGTDTTPVWDNPATAACGACHGATAASAPRRAAHFRHTGPYTDIGHEYPCSWCHQDPSVDASLHVNNRSEVNFSTNPTVSGGIYAGTTAMLDAYGNCTNVYCHSSVQTSPPGGPLTYKTINWGTSYGGDFGCSACHEGPMDHYSEPLNGNTSGSHPKHASSRIYCATCHANDVTQDPDPGVQGWACFTCHTWNGPNVTHANYAVDVNIVTKFGGMYTGTPAPGDAYGRCSSTYCHSSGVSVRTGSLSSSASVTWGSNSIACNSCHGNTLYPEPNSAMPDYPNGTPKENSHAVHVISNSVPCQNCHAGTTNDGLTIANTSLHVNKSYDMKAGGTFGGKTISFTYSAATTSAPGSCGAISCHSGNTAQWGATLNCQDCHLGTADMDDFSGAFWNNGTAGVVTRGEWTTTGHGRPAASGNYASGNLAGDFTAASNACQFCHDGSVGHKNAANPFRLRSLSDPAWGLNGVCQGCHASGSTGVTIDGVFKNGTRKIGSTHYGAGHGAANNGGQFCWDCHDPHGDGNVFMVHAAVARTSDPANGAPTSIIATQFTAFAIGTDYAKSASPYNGVCNVCHTTALHYTSTSGDGHNSGTACTQCHKHTGKTGTDGFSGGDCIGCHSVQQGSRAAVAAQFSGNSHHIQITELSTGHCYECHWEANADGSINPAYHGGSSAPGSPVNLVIYGAGARPGSYTLNETALEYTANGSRSEIAKITPHCLGCHSDQNDSTQPFGDGKTPKQYAWDGTSVGSRYSQAGTAPWGKYSSTSYNVTPKDIRTKAYSAHGNAANNEGGWDLNETWTNTRSGSTNIACFDCHNSHGSSVEGRTTNYVSATANGGILKDTTANLGGYAMSYKPVSGGSSADKNIRNAGASLCLDCHLTADGGAAQPWGYQATFGSIQEIIGYWDSPYMTPGGSASTNRYAYKSLVKNAGGHFGASSPLSSTPMGTINGLCTPCHDPHGVSPTLGSNQQYALPLLKGTWMTSIYKEDVAPAVAGAYTNIPGYEGIQYHIDQNTFGSSIRQTVTGITQTDGQFAGLCLGCHPKSSLTDGANGGAWKSVDRIHESVKGWGANVKHNYTCSKCHTIHNGASLPRLMVTNCLNGSHKGRNTTLSPVLFFSNSGAGPYGGGSGTGHMPGSYSGSGGGDSCCGGPNPGDGIVSCHESNTGSGTDQSWNVKTPWASQAPTIPALIDEPNAGCLSSCTSALVWHASADPESHAVQYLVQVDDAPDFVSPNYTSAWVSATNVTTVALATGATYYWRVKARDASDLEESPWSIVDTFIFSVPLPPPVPNLVNEPDNWCVSSCGVALYWNLVAAPDGDAVTYSVQVDDNADFSSPVYTSSWVSGTAISTNALAPGNMYFWRVKARDQLHQTQQSEWSVSDSFNVFVPQPPEVPTLIDRPNGICAGSCLTALRWNAVAPLPDGHSVQYQLQVDDTADFSSPVYTSGWTAATGLSPYLSTGAIYYWRVKARDYGHTTVVSNWSTPDTFEYIIGAPAQPTLINEPDALCPTACDQTFEWNPVTAPDGHGVEYSVEVDDTQNFSSPNYLSTWTTGTAWTTTLATDTTWYWRVTARDASHTWAVSTPSASDSFRINAVPAPPAPAMINPGGYNYYSDCANPVTVTLAWNGVTAPDSHPVQYYAEVTDGVTIWQSGWSGGTSWAFSAASQSGYSWRVKARDSVHTTAESSWSAWDYFGDYSACGPPSCPILYAWDGSAYAFETDVFSRGILGRKSGSTYARPNPHDYYLLAHDVNKTKAHYEFKYVEERSEIDYVDSLKLYTIDIPENRNVYAEANVTNDPTYYPPAQILHTVDTAERIAASAIHLNTGKDVSAKIAAADGDYLVLNENREYPAWQTLEMNLGDLSSAPMIKLIIKGVQAFPLTTAGNDRIKVVPGSKVKLEVPDGAGGWVNVTSQVRIANLGEFVRPMLIDISHIFKNGIYRVRLSYFTKNIIDSITFDTTADEPLEITELSFVSAELAYGGFNAKVDIFDDIYTYIYGDKVEKVLPSMPGSYTRFGDVTPLLTSVDDKFVIMGKGDELTYRFAAAPAPGGKNRKILLYGNGYYKAYKYEITRTVEPLPFAAMSNFPYNTAVENYPSDADHNQYRAEYNTRVQ